MPVEHVMKADGLRFAHSDGFTDICFSSEDGRFVSAGDDGYACIWTDGVTEDSQMMHQLGDSVSFLSVYKDLMHAVIANSTLSEFEFPSCAFKRICLKLSDQITHFATNSSHSTLAVASSDFKIRLLDRESLSVPLSLNDHQAPVLSVAFSSGSEEILASSSCDSTVRIWSAKDGKCISTFGRVLPKSNDVAHSPTLCRLKFSNDSTRLYVPTEGELKVYDVRNWHKPCEKIDLPKKTLVSSCVQFSKSGNHFAAICKDVLGVYSLAKSQWVARLNHTRPICAVAWHPFTANRLAFTDNRGQLGFVSAPIEESGSTLSNNLASNDVEMAEDDDAALMAVAAQLGDEEALSNDDEIFKAVMEEDSPKKEEKSAPMSKKKNFDFSDDEEKESVKAPANISKPVKPSKSETKKAVLKKFAMSDDEEESNSAPLALEEEVSNEEDAITDLGRIRNEFKEFFQDDEDEEEDDDSETASKQPKDEKKTSTKTSTPTAKPSTAAPLISGGQTSLAPGKPADSHLQRAFQISSTPAGRAGQSSRFLVWNQLGVVRLYESENESSVEAEFHDASVHPPISLTSSDEFTLAALTADVLVLASISANSDEDDENEGNRCRLRVLTLSSWDSSREWLLDLPSGEICTSIAVGSRWIAVTTDKQFIRLFSLAGFQLGILSVPGTPVTAAGSGDQLAIIYHNGIGANQCQNLAFDLYKMGSRNPKLVSSGNLPITPKSVLNWAGFGQDFGTFFTSDSSSILRVFSLANRTWTPVANLRRCGQIKSRADHYWVVGISEKQQQIYAIFCKASTHPSVLPRPILSTVPLGVPVCDSGSDAGKLADEAIRLSFFNTPGQQQLEDADMKLQETLMRLFAIAIKQERLCRAAEIAESMPSSHAIQLAGKYAARLRLGHLADVLNEMAMKFEQEQEQASLEKEEDPFASMDYRSSAPSTSTYRTEEPAEKLPVLATPPIVTLTKRPAGGPQGQSGLAKDFSALGARSSIEPAPKKSEEPEKKDEKDADDSDGSVEEIVPPEPEKEPPSEQPTESKNPFAKANPFARANPFKSRQSTEGGQNSASKPTIASNGDAFSCFERVEPSRPKAQPQSAAKEVKETKGRKKKAADPAGKEDGQASAKKKRTATKRKSEASAPSSTANEGDEGSDNSKRSSSKNSNGNNAENEEEEDASTSKPQEKNDEVVEKAKKPAAKASTKPNSSTLRKLTDFMFSKNE